MKLYLDDARMGSFCPTSAEAVADFVRFQCEEGSTSLFDDVLRDGFQTLPAEFQHKFAGLRDWRGVSAFKDSVRTVTGLAACHDVQATASSAQLVRTVARTQFSRCRNVLAIDVWPDYRRWLQRECDSAGGKITCLRTEDWILREGIAKGGLVERIRRTYDRFRCDGLFLPAVTHHGIRLPVGDIVTSLTASRRPRFVVVDGAQHFCHVPARLDEEGGDIYVTGCHKWLHAYIPMRLGICCRRETQEFFRRVCRDMLAKQQIDDPLLRFTQQLEARDPDRFTETADVLPLFSCSAAIAAQIAQPAGCRQRFQCQLDNGGRLANAAMGTGWKPLIPDPAFRTGIQLMQASCSAVRKLEPDVLRSCFRRHGISLTSYEGGLIRISLPTRPWTAGELDFVRSALLALGGVRATRAAIAATRSKVVRYTSRAAGCSALNLIGSTPKREDLAMM